VHMIRKLRKTSDLPLQRFRESSELHLRLRTYQAQACTLHQTREPPKPYQMDQNSALVTSPGLNNQSQKPENSTTTFQHRSLRSLQALLNNLRVVI
jgi:hypothetical protein